MSPLTVQKQDSIVEPLYFMVKDAKLISAFGNLNYTQDQVEGDV